MKLREGKLELALKDTLIACDSEEFLLEADIQRVHILVLLNRPEAEEEIKKLESAFTMKSDVRRALLCELHLQKGEWGLADRHWKSIWQKSLPNYQDLRRRMLQQKSEDPMVSIHEKDEIDAEIAKYKEIDLPLIKEDFEIL